MHNLVIKEEKEDELQKLSQEIVSLTSQLIQIYKKEFIYTLPLEFLFDSRQLEVLLKIEEDLRKKPIKNKKLLKAFLLEWNALFFETARTFYHLPSAHPDKFDEAPGDKRFTNPEWERDLHFQLLKRAYYLITKHSLNWLNSLSTIEDGLKDQLHLNLKNVLNLFSPTNFLLTNPDALRETLESKGENLLKGFKNFLEDLVIRKGHLSTRMTDLKAFTLGKNLACTKGQVVFQNDLIQLIQYSPTTTETFEIPLLFIPPWINKYYILDLSAENSLVKWLVDQGFTVYMISWVNPGRELAKKEFSDYMEEGPLQAIEFITRTLNVPYVHAVGYCIGGTLLGATLAYMQATGDSRIKSATYFMSLLDFSNPGELGVFIDAPQLNALERVMKKKGYLDGRLLEMSFNILRPNDLIWPYYINNYLLGHSPKPFDLLYWNADSTNLPYKMYNYYLRNMYLHNRLRKKNVIKLKGVPLNLRSVSTPSFFLASETDHITLWDAVYAGTNLLKGPIRFVLSSSGHVRGVINPPGPNNRYRFRTNEKYGQNKKMPRNPNKWLVHAKERKGSWWPYWIEWLQSIDSTRVKARDPATLGIEILEEAPGSYVRKRL